MNDLISAPSLRFRVFAGLAKWALRVLAMDWLAIGLLWCGLHFLIVPRIAELRPWVETQATQALGLPVRIGDMQARSNGVIPSIELLRVSVLDQEGREALVLPSVLAALSPRSLLVGGLEQLHIDSPSLDIRRSADGSWWIAGLPVSGSNNTDGRVADWLFSQPEIALLRGRVTWTDETRPVESVVFDDVDLVIRNSLRGHALRLDATPPASWRRAIRESRASSWPSTASTPGAPPSARPSIARRVSTGSSSMPCAWIGCGAPGASARGAAARHNARMTMLTVWADDGMILEALARLVEGAGLMPK